MQEKQPEWDMFAVIRNGWGAIDATTALDHADEFLTAAFKDDTITLQLFPDGSLICAIVGDDATPEGPWDMMGAIERGGGVLDAATTLTHMSELVGAIRNDGESPISSLLLLKTGAMICGVADREPAGKD